MGDAVSTVQDQTSVAALRVKRKNSLNSEVEVGGFEVLEHDLSHLLPISFGVSGG